MSQHACRPDLPRERKAAHQHVELQMRRGVGEMREGGSRPLRNAKLYLAMQRTLCLRRAVCIHVTAVTVRTPTRACASRSSLFSHSLRSRDPVPHRLQARLVSSSRSRAVSAMAASLFEYTVKDTTGSDVDLSEYKGKVVLVTNVASECGLTKQYKGLAELQDNYSSKGFDVLAFPCNQFGKQEPADNPEIKKFAEGKGFMGPVFAKIDVNGPKADPVFKYLKKASGDEADIGWNFGKFLVGKDGSVIKRYEPTVEPAQVEDDIKAALAA